MKLVLKYLKRYPKLILLNIIGIFSFVAVQLGIPTVMAWMIDNGIGNGDIAYSTYMTRDIRNDVFTQSQKFSHTEYNNLVYLQ